LRSGQAVVRSGWGASEEAEDLYCPEVAFQQSRTFRFVTESSAKTIHKSAVAPAHGFSTGPTKMSLLERLPLDALEGVAGYLSIEHLAMIYRSSRQQWVVHVLAAELCRLLVVGPKVTSLSILRAAVSLGPRSARALCVTTRFPHTFTQPHLLQDVPSLCPALAEDHRPVLCQGVRLHGAGRKIHADPDCRALGGSVGTMCSLPWSMTGLRRQLCRRCYTPRSGWRQMQTIYTGNNLHKLHVNNRLFAQGRGVVARLVSRLRQDRAPSPELVGISHALEAAWPSLFSTVLVPPALDVP
jgi:hypothetical protein